MASNSKPSGGLSGGLSGAYYGPSIPPSRTHHSVGRRSSSCCCCDPCGCLIWPLLKLLFSAVLTVGIIFLVLWLVFRPNELKVAVEDAKLTTFRLDNSSFLNYNLSLSVSIRNPNRRIAIYYDKIEALAFYDGNQFGYDESLPVFFQGHKNTTVISPEFGGQAVALAAVNGTYAREKGEGSFFVDVKLDARIRLKVKFVKVGHFKPKFHCKLKLPVPPAKGGSPAIGFQRTECNVDWI